MLQLAMSPDMSKCTDVENIRLMFGEAYIPPGLHTANVGYVTYKHRIHIQVFVPSVLYSASFEIIILYVV